MIAYLDCPSGISGDIFLACLVDAGWSIDRLRAAVDALHLPAGEFDIREEEVQKGSLRARRVMVEVRETKHSRGLRDIRTLLDRSDLPRDISEKAGKVFGRLAAAEAKVHGISIDAVHFHEVGALDAIIDVVGTVAGLHETGISRLYASAIPLGEGWARTEHGLLPLPAPATLELLASAKVPTKPAPGPGELVTPTGAALLAELATFIQPHLTLHKIGVGAGQKEFAWPNVARLWVGEERNASPLVQIETNIDDMNPQFYTPVTEKLFAAGALDVWLTPTLMKKGRPATTLSVLAPSSAETIVAQTLLRETTTLGLRVHPVTRHEAIRSVFSVQTGHGAVRVKAKYLDGKAVDFAPEYDDCLELSRKTQVPISEIARLAADAARADRLPA